MFCKSLTYFSRRPSRGVKIGGVVVGGGNPVVAQSMASCDTLDTAACVAQAEAVAAAGGALMRFTAQGRREAANLGNVVAALRERGVGIAVSADVHFTPSVAMAAAEHADKVRINPGNYGDPEGPEFRALLARCRERGVALRVGVNHGSLSPRIVERWGDTPAGMVASAMEFLRVCVAENFRDVVVSMKSSNVRVMVHSVRLLAEAMEAEGIDFPLHLGVTEAGDGEQGRVKSAVGIGALLADGLGDTLRVSLTEAPEREIPVARLLASYVALREGHEPIEPVADASLYHYADYFRRPTGPVGRVGGTNPPLLYNELNEQELKSVENGEILLFRTHNANFPAAARARILNRWAAGDRRPVIVRKTYAEESLEALQVKAGADFGMLFLDGLADGLWIDNRGAIPQAEVDSLALALLQAARARFSRTEYIACPGCGRTLYDLQGTLAAIRARTQHLKGLKIGVMGCIVNGPGEMADADYGYVGSGPGRISLYRGHELVRRNIPQAEATEALVELIKENGDWTDPQ